MDYLLSKVRGDLYGAVKAGDIARVRKLVEREDVNRAGPDGRTPLMLAAAAGYDVILGELLDRQAASWHADPDGRNAVHLAALGGHTSSIIVLFGNRNRDSPADKAALLSARDREGNTPLHLACIYGQQAAAEVLLKKGADANSLQSKFGYTALHLATERGHMALLPTLLVHGAVLDGRTGQTGRSALHLAALAGQLDMCTALLQLGANTGAKDNWGKTPLEAAREASQPAAANLLKSFVLGAAPPAGFPAYIPTGAAPTQQPYDHRISLQSPPQPQTPSSPPQVQQARITVPQVLPQASQYPSLPNGAGVYY